MLPTHQMIRMGACALGFTLVASACASTEATETEAETAEEEDPHPGLVSVVAYEEKTQALVEAMDALEALRGDVDEQRRRLQAVCVDHPDHAACQAHAAARYAKQAFCEDDDFVRHVDEIVEACHQGACKEVDEASLLSRTQYMRLVSHLPHKLVLFRSAETHLDRDDERQLQQYVETIGADEGYMIIVGRASREGPWRDNLRYALDRAESTRAYIVDQLGVDARRVGYITYGHEKMYLTQLDAERLTQQRLSTREANRSALLFVYPCFRPADDAASR